MRTSEKDSPNSIDMPIRTRNCSMIRSGIDSLYFHQQKWHLIQRLLNHDGVNTMALRWLDVGCGRGELLECSANRFCSYSSDRA
jgi:2-polyprenyl-3-methyl-5-hydroxy-6-metoxy-1,4-benzoquinol methylase